MYYLIPMQFTEENKKKNYYSYSIQKEHFYANPVFKFRNLKSFYTLPVLLSSATRKNFVTLDKEQKTDLSMELFLGRYVSQPKVEIIEDRKQICLDKLNILDYIRYILTLYYDKRKMSFYFQPQGKILFYDQNHLSFFVDNLEAVKMPVLFYLIKYLLFCLETIVSITENKVECFSWFTSIIFAENYPSFFYLFRPLMIFFISSEMRMYYICKNNKFDVEINIEEEIVKQTYSEYKVIYAFRSCKIEENYVCKSLDIITHLETVTVDLSTMSFAETEKSFIKDFILPLMGYLNVLFCDADATRQKVEVQYA